MSTRQELFGESRNDLTPPEKTIAAAKHATIKFGENQYRGRHKVGTAPAVPSKTQEKRPKSPTSGDQIQRAKKVVDKARRNCEKRCAK